jgi:hypothetical protein
MPVARSIAALALAASLVLPAALTAQPAATQAPAAAAAPAQTPEEARAALNRTQAEAAQNQVGENFAREDNYADAVKARAAEVKRQQEAHAAAMAQYEAQKAKYEADLAQWRAACANRKRYKCVTQ